MVQGNPCLEYIKYIIFPWFNKFEVQRNEANGGAKVYTAIEELYSDYESGALHPGECEEREEQEWGGGRPAPG